MMFVLEELGMSSHELALELSIEPDVIDAALSGDDLVLVKVSDERLDRLYHKARNRAF